MQFKIISFILLVFTPLTSFAFNKHCQGKVEKMINEMDEWGKYGIKRDPRGVVEFPTKCTPFMKKQGMIPLPKRKVAGVNRDRYMGKDCNVYEWDSQHGAFEVYKPNSSISHFYHEGEASVILGEASSKVDAKRNHDATDTGIPGMKMKDLCKKYGSGKFTAKDLSKSKAKSFLNCL